MALASAPSGVSENQEAKKSEALSVSALKNVAALVSVALENKEATTKIVKNGFIDLFSKNIQVGIQAVETFHKNFKTGLDNLKMIDRLPKIQGVTNTFEKLFSNLAQKTLDVNGDSALNGAKQKFDATCDLRNKTYHGIQENLCTQITGKGFPTQTA